MKKSHDKTQASLFSDFQDYFCCCSCCHRMKDVIEIVEVVEIGIQTDGSHVLTFINEEEMQSFVRNMSKTSDWSTLSPIE